MAHIQTVLKFGATHAKKGAKLFVMDPRRQTLSRHATRHLQFKPSSDVAMLIMARILASRSDCRAWRAS